MKSYDIAIWIWNGVEELDFAGPYEVLSAWARSSEREITVRTVAATADPVTCSHGLRVIPDLAWDALGQVDLFVHPGGQTGPLVADEEWLQRVRDVQASGALMTSVCNGAVVYGEAGLLAGRPATTHWSAVQSLRDLGIAVDEDARFVDDGDVVTSAGVSAGIDMALHLVARLENTETAKQVRRYIQYDPQPPV
jgi:transcriptional regulator GlxA family with amidase domain